MAEFKKSEAGAHPYHDTDPLLPSYGFSRLRKGGIRRQGMEEMIPDCISVGRESIVIGHPEWGSRNGIDFFTFECRHYHSPISHRIPNLCLARRLPSHP